MFSEEAPWGARKINDQSYLMFESPSVINLPASSGRYTDTGHLCALINVKGMMVAGQQVDCKDISLRLRKMPRCMLTV